MTYLVKFRDRGGNVRQEYIEAPNEVAANNRAYTEYQAQSVISVTPNAQTQLFGNTSRPEQYLEHNLQWEPGQEGKGFLIKPSEVGLQNFPALQGAAPIVWTWPTEEMRPTHPQMQVRTTGEVPQGMTPDKTSYFHIRPDGGIWLYGSGRKLSDEDYEAIKGADSRLNPATYKPQVETDGYGHANRLLDILNNKVGRLWRGWRESR